MPHPIYPPDRDGSGSSDGLRSCEGDAIQANDHDLSVIKSSTSSGELPISTEFTASAMSLTVLAEHCLSEINCYRVGEFHSDTYFVELLRRATLDGNQDAWEIVKQCLRMTVHEWLTHHPKREVWFQQESEEKYMAEAFARFYQATIERQVELDRLSVVLQYLQACLNSAILDNLRASSRLQVIPLREPRNSEESLAVDPASNECWEVLRKMFPNTREQHLAYLLFHCALKPREVIHLFPVEFHDVQEISRLRCSIIKRLLDQMDQFERR